MKETPAELGYRFPAEWELHAATWLSWPHRRATWPGKFEPIPAFWAELARTIAPFEPVHILAGGPEVLAQARAMVGQVTNVTIHDIPTNDAWTRDHGPTFLAGRSGLPPALIDWQFNSWGGKYRPFDLDDAVPRRIAELTGRRRFEPGIVLEGGSIDSNGRGTILTTTDCLLNRNRNPGRTKADLERILGDYLGAKQVLWLSGTMVGDDTDGHVDQLTRFVGPRTVVTAREPDSLDDNHAALEANFRHLHTLADQDGWPLEVIPLPMPRSVCFGGQRLPASYANFYLVNGAVIVPQFDDPSADAEALSIFGQLFRDRVVRGLRAVDLVLGRGAIHCITQQEPA